MTIDHETATTTLSHDDIRAVATAFARVAANLSEDAIVRRMCEELRLRDLDAVERYMQPFREEYRRCLPSLPRDVNLRCVAAFAIDGAARAYAEPDAYEAIFAARDARRYCECVVQCIDFGVVDLSGPNHAASLAKVHALAAKYVSPETIAAVLA
jgi:hypothetical protein